MIKSYIKLAWRVLVKKKFFSFITLFGISITLMVLMVFIAFWEAQTGANPPITNKDRLVFAHRMQTQIVEQDTLVKYDTTHINGVMHIDSTYDISDNIQSTSNSALSHFLIDKQLRNIDRIEQYTAFSSEHSFDLFVNEIKLQFKAVYADKSYFDVFDFIFIDGQKWTTQEVEQQASIVIISEEGALDYFGTTEGVVGKEIEIESKHFKVIGIVKTPSASMGYIHSHAYLPYTHLPPHLFSKDSYLGNFEMCFLANSASDIPNIKEQILAQTKDLPDVTGEGYNRSQSIGHTFEERFARSMMHYQDPTKNVNQLYTIISVILSLFILLPILNLVNLNVSRMMDRSAEIGVRKSFGAGKYDLVLQFIFENVILTLIGGAIGFVLTVLLINVLNSSGAMGRTHLHINFTMLLYSVLVTIIFGILSGILPALRMAKIHIVQALKRN